MSGARLEKTGGVFAGIRGGFFRAENDADASRSFAAVEWYDLDRLLGPVQKHTFRVVEKDSFCWNSGSRA